MHCERTSPIVHQRRQGTLCLSLTITVDLIWASHFAIQLEVAFVSQTVLHTFICLCVMLWINENSSEDYGESVHT